MYLLSPDSGINQHFRGTGYLDANGGICGRVGQRIDAATVKGDLNRLFKDLGKGFGKDKRMIVRWCCNYGNNGLIVVPC